MVPRGADVPIVQGESAQPDRMFFALIGPGDIAVGGDRHREVGSRHLKFRFVGLNHVTYALKKTAASRETHRRRTGYFHQPNTSAARPWRSDLVGQSVNAVPLAALLRIDGRDVLGLARRALWGRIAANAGPALALCQAGWVDRFSASPLRAIPTRSTKEIPVSNHFTGLSLGPPLGDQRLDLCDLYAFQSPSDPSRTVLILNANPNADALHPDAIYRLAVDNDGDLLNDIAFSYVFSKPVNDRQTVTSTWRPVKKLDSPEPVGEKIFSGLEVSFGYAPNIATSGDITFFAGARSDAFFFDFDGIKNLFDTSGNATSPHPTSADHHRGREWIPTPKPTSSPPSSSCPPNARRRSRHPDLGPLQFAAQR